MHFTGPDFEVENYKQLPGDGDCVLDIQKNPEECEEVLTAIQVDSDQDSSTSNNEYHDSSVVDPTSGMTKS